MWVRPAEHVVDRPALVRDPVERNELYSVDSRSILVHRPRLHRALLGAGVDGERRHPPWTLTCCIVRADGADCPTKANLSDARRAPSLFGSRRARIWPGRSASTGYEWHDAQPRIDARRTGPQSRTAGVPVLRSAPGSGRHRPRYVAAVRGVPTASPARRDGALLPTPSLPLRLLLACPARRLRDPEQIFSEYAYFSSYSDSWLAHAGRFARSMFSPAAPRRNEPRHRTWQQRWVSPPSVRFLRDSGARDRARRERSRNGTERGDRHDCPVLRGRDGSRAGRERPTRRPARRE